MTVSYIRAIQAVGGIIMLSFLQNCCGTGGFAARRDGRYLFSIKEAISYFGFLTSGLSSSESMST